MSKKAILVISFGTSYLDNLKLSIQAVEELIIKTFPEYKVCRAFTSKVIIKHIYERDGIYINNVDETLSELASNGYAEVYCLPTHIMNGIEYDELTADIKKYENKFNVLKNARPLLSLTEDYDEVITALSQTINFNNDKYFILMGHGTSHFANAVYCALDYHFKHNGFKNVYIATVEGFPRIDDILKKLKDKQKKDIVLIPFMLVAGDHANNDMVGDDENSWKNILESNNYNVEYILKGLGEYPLIRQIYINRLYDII